MFTFQITDGSTLMPSTSKERGKKRLTRLIDSRRCEAVEAPKYVSRLQHLASRAADAEAVKSQSKFFKALADETRLRILKLLAIREMCVCEVMVALDLTQPTASHHLGLLENISLVKARKEGKWVFYSVASPELIENLQKLKLM